MLTVAEALNSILAEVQPLAAERTPLADAQGLHLAEHIIADVDSPPFDKALMDGYAIIASDITDSSTQSGTAFEVIEEVTAGRVPQKNVSAGQATRIMTGAPLPDGVDCVIKIEDTDSIGALDAGSDDGHQVRVLATTARPEQNLIRRGTNMKTGDVVLPAGRLLRPQELAGLAEMGTHQVVAHRQPKVAVLATGDELVGVDQVPGPGQIRNSNETMLTAQIRQAGASPNPQGVARDERDHLRGLIKTGLKNDVLLLSGGVSAGKLDLVPSELAHAGVEQVFHKVQVKPGKPIWFGVLRQQNHVCYVFGLPGNPVSSMVCFEIFVRPALRRLLGDPIPNPKEFIARISHPHQHNDTRTTYFPAFVDTTQDQFAVTLMKWHGSSDLQSTTNANAMAVFPAEPRDYKSGDPVPVILWRSST
jgi:molybdopterin molybdotransferase